MKTFIMIVCHVGEPEPRVVIEADPEHAPLNKLAAMQAQVAGPTQDGGGLIETIARMRVGDVTLDCYANEEGNLLDLPYNRVITTSRDCEGYPVVGPVIVTAANDEGETISLDGETIAAAMNWARSWRCCEGVTVGVDLATEGTQSEGFVFRCITTMPVEEYRGGRAELVVLDFLKDTPGDD